MKKFPEKDLKIVTAPSAEAEGFPFGFSATSLYHKMIPGEIYGKRSPYRISRKSIDAIHQSILQWMASRLRKS